MSKAGWNPEQYLKFEQQRTQPAIDLANRLRGRAFRRMADLGCGPGNSTQALRSVFPEGELVGIDQSPEMLEKARKKHPQLSFRLGDVRGLEGGWDLLFSNACLQWVPDHEALLPQLMGKLNEGGALAVQIPRNGGEPFFQIIDQVAAGPQWGFDRESLEKNGVLSPQEYYNILSRCSRDFDLWETVYCHSMPSRQAMLEWVRSTRLRPYLAALDEERAAAFQREILERAAQAYPAMEDGSVLFRFRRLFFVAYR